MKAFIVGAGAAATTLAIALRRAGVDVLGMHGRDPARTSGAARLAGVKATTGPLPAAMTKAGVVWIAVSDDAVEEVARTLAASGLLRRPQIVLHCSGALGRDALRAVARRVSGTGSLHPMQSLADPVRAAARLRGATFAVEGTPRARRSARAIARRLGGRPLEIPARGKALYHAAAMMTSGGTVGVFGAAVEALEAAGVPRARAARTLLPLLRGTVDNLAALGVTGALTGPVARGDARTIAHHRAAIRLRTPGLAALYAALVGAQDRLARRGARRR